MFTSAATCIKLVSVPQPKPMHGFSPNFQDVQENLQLIRFFFFFFFFFGGGGGGYLATAVGNTFKILVSYKLLALHSLNQSTDFHQIFRICLPQEDVELIRIWGGIQVQLVPWQHFWVLKFVGVSQPKPMHRPQEDIQLITFWWVSSHSCCHVSALNAFHS